jgi:hypothetical protein
MYGLVERNGVIGKFACMQGDLVELVAEVVELLVNVHGECLDCVKLLKDCIDVPDGGMYADCKD